jgi:hypothetical protein
MTKKRRLLLSRYRSSELPRSEENLLVELLNRFKIAFFFFLLQFVMSAILRPHGDALAAAAKDDYFSESYLASIKVGDKMDMLCRYGCKF